MRGIANSFIYDKMMRVFSLRVNKYLKRRISQLSAQ